MPQSIKTTFKFFYYFFKHLILLLRQIIVQIVYPILKSVLINLIEAVVNPLAIILRLFSFKWSNQLKQWFYHFYLEWAEDLPGSIKYQQSKLSATSKYSRWKSDKIELFQLLYYLRTPILVLTDLFCDIYYYYTQVFGAAYLKILQLLTIVLYPSYLIIKAYIETIRGDKHSQPGKIVKKTLDQITGMYFEQDSHTIKKTALEVTGYQTLFQTIPQFIILTINNFLMHEWTVFAIISYVISFIMLIKNLKTYLCDRERILAQSKTEQILKQRQKIFQSDRKPSILNYLKQQKVFRNNKQKQLQRISNYECKFQNPLDHGIISFFQVSNFIQIPNEFIFLPILKELLALGNLFDANVLRQKQFTQTLQFYRYKNIQTFTLTQSQKKWFNQQKDKHQKELTNLISGFYSLDKQAKLEWQIEKVKQVLQIFKKQKFLVQFWYHNYEINLYYIILLSRRRQMKIDQRKHKINQTEVMSKDETIRIILQLDRQLAQIERKAQQIPQFEQQQKRLPYFEQQQKWLQWV